MRFKVPPRCHAVTHGGVALAISPEGAIEAETEAATHLLAHGIVPWPETDRDAPLVPATARERLVTALEAAGVPGPYPKTPAAPRARPRGSRTRR
jgi:hypothetical protein